MNVLFICVDCLRNDFIDSDHADTPFLDSFVEESLYFDNLYSTTTTTTPAVASFMTGFYSETNGINSLRNAELDDNLDTIAERFSSKNYNTHAETTGPLIKDTDLDRGFDLYNNRSHSKELFTEWEQDLWGEIENLDRPFFFYLHLWELHKPIKVPEKFDSQEYGDSDYARALSALDRRLEELVERLPDETTVILHGDHGESITWRNNFVQRNLKRARTLLRYKLGLNTRPLERWLNNLMDRGDFRDHFIEDGHGENIFDFTTNVPFLINSPDIDPEKITAQVRQIDIYPTILELADIEHETVRGQTLLSEEIEDRKAYIRGCGSSLKTDENWIRGIRTGGWKYLEYPNREWVSELYNLNKDPKELKNVKDDEKRQEFEKDLPSEEMAKAKKLEIKDKLEELGYM